MIILYCALRSSVFILNSYPFRYLLNFSSTEGPKVARMKIGIQIDEHF